MSTAERIHLARANMAMISVALGRAAAGGTSIEVSVVLLLDTRDVLARDLARALVEVASDLDFDAEEKRVLRRDEIPTGIAVVPVDAATQLFRETHPEVTASLARMPHAGSTRVVVVAGGGASLMHLPVGAHSTIGDA